MVLDTSREASHVFRMPALLQSRECSLAERFLAWETTVDEVGARLAAIQAEIDEVVVAAYCLPEQERKAVETAVAGSGAQRAGGNAEAYSYSELEMAHDLVSYALGCLFGRWDIRLAIDPDLTTEALEPFDPLSSYPPAALRPGALPHDYPLQVSDDGILVEDPGHPNDISRSLQRALALVLGTPDGMDQELCKLLGSKTLGEYFRSPGRFFQLQIRKCSVSKRIAPIYWLLQSPNRAYALWVYYHALDSDTLFKALKLYVEPKIRLEEDRLEATGAELSSATPGSREAKTAAADRERQEDLLSDLLDFRDRLQRAAALNLQPDLDDGVILNMAPLHELVPWNEPRKYWDELLAGKYAWSSIGQQLRERGLVKVDGARA